MKAEKKLVNVRMSETLAEELKETSERLEIGQSQFIRDAVREKLTKLKEPVRTETQEAIA